MRADETGEQRLTRESSRRLEAERSDFRDEAVFDDDLLAANETAAAPGEIGFDELALHEQNLAINARSTSPARWNSSFGVNSFGLCATSIAPGPKSRQSMPSDCSQPASLANETDSTPL